VLPGNSELAKKLDNLERKLTGSTKRARESNPSDLCSTENSPQPAKYTASTEAQGDWLSPKAFQEVIPETPEAALPDIRITPNPHKATLLAPARSSQLSSCKSGW
jgi:hypothetical protein